MFDDISSNGVISPASVIIPQDISIAFQSAGITIGCWGGAFFWNSTFTPPEGGPPQQIGAYIMSHPAELEKFLTANAEGANASLGAGIPTGLMDGGQVNPDAARLFFNLGYGLSTLASANIPESLKEAILGRSFAIATGQSPTGSPDLIDGWTFAGTDANGHGIWQRIDQVYGGDYGVAVTSTANAATAAGLDARRAIRQSQDEQNNFGPPQPDDRTELDPNSDGSYEVRQVYADYTGLETVNAAGQETAVGKMNADGSSSTAIYDTGNTQPWSYYVVNSNALNQAVEQVVFFDPGQSQVLTDTTFSPGTSIQLQQIIQYSPSGGSGYSDEWWNYLPSGQARANLERFNSTDQETLTRTDTPDGGYVQSTFAYATSARSTPTTGTTARAGRRGRRWTRRAVR